MWIGFIKFNEEIIDCEWFSFTVIIFIDRFFFVTITER